MWFVSQSYQCVCVCSCSHSHCWERAAHTRWWWWWWLSTRIDYRKKAARTQRERLKVLSSLFHFIYFYQMNAHALTYTSWRPILILKRVKRAHTQSLLTLDRDSNKVLQQQQLHHAVVETPMLVCTVCFYTNCQEAVYWTVLNVCVYNFGTECENVKIMSFEGNRWV